MSEEKRSQTDQQKHTTDSPPKPGDQIHAQIGDDVRGVAVGKNIIQIGSFKVPIWALAIVVAGVVIGVGFIIFDAHCRLMLEVTEIERAKLEG